MRKLLPVAHLGKDRIPGLCEELSLDSFQLIDEDLVPGGPKLVKVQFMGQSYGWDKIVVPVLSCGCDIVEAYSR